MLAFVQVIHLLIAALIGVNRPVAVPGRERALTEL